jgi:zona occludens toxin (predicted ATPase)
MRRGLLWLLGGVVALTAVVLWVPQRATTIVQAIEARRSAGVQTPALTAAAALPARLERVTVEPARRDPFADAAIPTAVVPAKPALLAAVAAVPQPMPAPAPSLPALQWRLMGTMATPNGQRLVVLTHSNEQQTVVAEPGVQLDGGYEVTAVTADAVRLLYPPLQTEVVIPIPPPQGPDR